MILESNSDLINYYECLSEEINFMLKFLSKSNPEVILKLASDGWSGNILALGTKDQILKLGDQVIEYYEKSIENRPDSSNMWISDDIPKYCYWSQIGGSISFLNPAYEDFMLLDLK